MSKLKLSPVFRMNNLPVHPGVYKLKQPRYEIYIWSWFEDGRFNGAWPSKQSAVENYDWHSDGCSATSTGWQGIVK